jgi:hypothetical protein
MGANVTDHGLKEYLEVFHETLVDTANQFLAADAKSLTHTSVLPAKITGYVSSQHGVGIDYVRSQKTSIAVFLGSARAEDLLFGTPSSLRNKAPAVMIQGRHNTFVNCGFHGCPLRVTESGTARLIRCSAAQGSWKREVAFAELFGNRSATYWSREAAIARAKDEVLAGLTEAGLAHRRSLSLPEFISRFKGKKVLLLGDYSGEGLIRLEQFRRVLEARGYQPLMVKDVPDQPEQSLTQKVAMLGLLARFVIVDDSSKSGHLFEISDVCKHNNLVTAILRLGGATGSWMSVGLEHLSRTIRESRYQLDDVDSAVTEAIEWAERTIKDLAETFDDLYPWRSSELPPLP